LQQREPRFPTTPVVQFVQKLGEGALTLRSLPAEERSRRVLALVRDNIALEWASLLHKHDGVQGRDLRRKIEGPQDVEPVNWRSVIEQSEELYQSRGCRLARQDAAPTVSPRK
jgi:hypothetical protein